MPITRSSIIFQEADYSEKSTISLSLRKQVLSVEGNFKAIREMEIKKKANLCWEYGLVNSTIQTIWKTRTKIISPLDQNASRTMRFRKPERSDVDEA